jgi:Golgi SNAP receptor complex protein 1
MFFAYFATTNRLKSNQSKNSVLSSHNLADQAIKIAMDTQESLRFQRGLYKGLNRRMLELSQQFPLLNAIISRISIRKRRDSFIMGSVVAVCIILILIYSGHL